MSPDDDTDYVTLTPAVGHGKWNVVVMRYDPTTREYVIARMSYQLPETAARALAQSWAAATHLEVR